MYMRNIHFIYKEFGLMETIKPTPCVCVCVRACLGDEDDADEGEGGGDPRGRGEEVAGVVEDGQVLRLRNVVMHIMILKNSVENGQVIRLHYIIMINIIAVR